MPTHATIRSTQRAPRSCTSCSKRKVRCDKSIPCQPCVQRGVAATCQRELVRVRGALQTAGPDSTSPSYEDLVQENLRLRTLLMHGARQDGSGGGAEGSPSSHVPPPDAAASAVAGSASRTDTAERQLFCEIGRATTPRAVRALHDIRMPSEEFSAACVEFGFRWTFWLHYALFVPRFRQDHADFWTRLAAGSGCLDTEDPFWLAVYFGVLSSSLLFMDETDTAPYRTDFGDTTLIALVRNWYDAALFFLDRADFMARQELRTVQAIVILGIVCNNVGDVYRHQTLWSVAVRQAQELGLGHDQHHPAESYIDQQARRRLWWTLVLCDWFPVPFRSPCVSDIDFQCALPDVIDDEELESGARPSRLPKSKPRPIVYHITMIKVSRIYYMLRYRLRLCAWPAEDAARFVFAADEQLANLIAGLPTYLQFDEAQTAATAERDARAPFVPWQKKNLTRVLLYYRMAISRQLQEHWLRGAAFGARARAICMSSASGIISSIAAETVDVSKLRPWYFAVNIFSASVTLALESASTDEDCSEQIQQGLDTLYRIRAQNMIAEHSIRILESLLMAKQDGAQKDLLTR